MSNPARNNNYLKSESIIINPYQNKMVGVCTFLNELWFAMGLGCNAKHVGMFLIINISILHYLLF